MHLMLLLTEVCQYFDKDVSRVYSYLGWEQEYFLVDKALADIRPDLVLTDRTMVGCDSAKHQQLEDQYFGVIAPRVSAFMKDLEIEAYKLGLPLKTRHNEVAPNQFEVAPIYEECNVGVDHNLLTMILMKQIAAKHDLACLLHEKPFKGINGSGKHNNWSVGTNTGVNLLQPGKNPKSNLQFLTFVANVITAVYRYEDLLKASIATAGNAHRLGANEAPPAIVSVFLGTALTKLIEQVEEKVSDHKTSQNDNNEVKLDISIPELIFDNTDRNRTSPFAFTGNKFEFRAVGSSANCSSGMVTLNTILAETLKGFKKEVDALISKDIAKDEALLQVIRKYIKESKPICYDGNNYSEEWLAEAKKRNLNDEGIVPKIYDIFLTPKNKKVFIDNKVFTDVEIETRTEVKHEIYVKKINIESNILHDIAMNMIVPVAIDYQTSLIENVKGLKAIFDEKEFVEVSGNRLELIKENIQTHHCHQKTVERNV